MLRSGALVGILTIRDGGDVAPLELQDLLVLRGESWPWRCQAGVND